MKNYSRQFSRPIWKHYREKYQLITKNMAEVTININFKNPLPILKKKILKGICSLTKHKWQKYTEGAFDKQKERLMQLYMNTFMFGTTITAREITHVCTRCGEYKYKIQKTKEVKSKVVSFSRYSPLRS